MLTTVQRFVKQVQTYSFSSATLLVLLTALAVTGCTRASLPESSLPTVTVIAQDSTEFIEPVYHPARGRSYVRYKMKDSDVPTFFDPIEQVTVPMPGGGSSHTELSNGSLVFYNDPRDPSFTLEEDLNLYIISLTKGTVDHLAVTRSQIANYMSDEQHILFLQGFTRLSPELFMYSGQLFGVTPDGVTRGPRADYYQHKIGAVPFIWVDQPGPDRSNKYYPFSCDPTSLKIQLDPMLPSNDASLPFFYPAEGALECLHARYTRVFNNQYTSHYVLVTDNPTVPQDVLPVRVSGNKTEEQIKKVFQGQIQQLLITPAHLPQEPSTRISPYDKRYKVELKEEVIPYKIGEYFRYQMLTLSVNDDVQGILHRYRITILGFSPTSLFLLSEHGVERIDLPTG